MLCSRFQTASCEDGMGIMKVSGHAKLDGMIATTVNQLQQALFLSGTPTMIVTTNVPACEAGPHDSNEKVQAPRICKLM